MTKALLEADAVNLVQDHEPHRLVSQADDSASFEKQSRLELGQVKAELA